MSEQEKIVVPPTFFRPACGECPSFFLFFWTQGKKVIRRILCAKASFGRQEENVCGKSARGKWWHDVCIRNDRREIPAKMSDVPTQ
jgi:hypothetical protein